MTQVTSRRHEYDEPTIEKALLALAISGGNSWRACTQLEEIGITIPASTLRDWKNNLHPDRYRKTCEQIAPEIEREAAVALRANIRRSLEVQADAIEVAHGELWAGKADGASTLKNLAVHMGVSVEKLFLIEGRPTSINESRDSETDWHSVAKRLGVVVDSTADEIPAEATELPSRTSSAPSRALVSDGVTTNARRHTP